MTQHDIPRLLAFADTLADAARTEILPRFRAGTAVDNKDGAGRFDPVTEADRGAERAIRALVAEHFPEHGVLGEEYGETPSRSGYSWVLDPVDGTRAFIAGLPTWGVLIALAYEGKPIIGVMDQPYLDERFKGWPGGASLAARGETRPLKTRACVAMQDALVATTDPYLFREPEDVAFGRVRAAARLVRYGYDCYAYAMVALGGLDCVVESGLKAWDIQALIPIVEGAGGTLTSWSGGDASQGGRVLACGDARVRDEAMALLA